MSEEAQVTGEPLQKTNSFETEKHHGQRGDIKRHSRAQVETLPKAGNKRQQKCPFGMYPAC